jgi:hypothetical protein
MSRNTQFVGWILVLTVVAGLSSGCVDRRFVIESDPQNANVYINNKLVGATPANAQFTYYGDYQFVFDHDGCDRLTVIEHVRPPWYEWFPLEFIAENLLPWTIHDIHYIGVDAAGKLKLLPAKPLVSEQETLEKANIIRVKGQTIGVPEVPQPGKLTAVPAVIVPPPG